MVDDLGRPTARTLAKSLGVSEQTVRRWQKSDKAPRAVLLALYWLTRWGRSEIEARAGFELDNARLLADAYKRDIAALQARVAYLQLIGSFGTSNDPLHESVPVLPIGARAVPR